MLRHTSELHGYAVGATDGRVGTIKDLLFDDATWRVRWLIIDTGSFLASRKVLFPPSALTQTDHIGRQVSVGLTKHQLRDSPDIDTDKPVSSQMDAETYTYYGSTPYLPEFTIEGYDDAGGHSKSSLGLHPRDGADEIARRTHSDKHLRSVREVTGYHIRARDGDIGHVTDLFLEDGDWSITSLVIDTSNWWTEKSMLASTRNVDSIDWENRTIYVNLSRQSIKDNLHYDGSEASDRVSENKSRSYGDSRVIPETL